MVTVVKGDLIEQACNGTYNVIVHGCNCFCRQKSGIAKDMVTVFGTDTFPKEHEDFRGDINKLGTIDYKEITRRTPQHGSVWGEDRTLTVVNAYTQFNYGTDKRNLDYEALTLCMRKINHKFRGLSIGIPGLIGCGLAGGNEEIVMSIIETELRDCDVSIVYLNRDPI